MLHEKRTLPIEFETLKLRHKELYDLVNSRMEETGKLSVDNSKS
ncbi:MAG: hypothetical protein ACRD97_07775 [Nitrososphaeraceae archaeon]